MACKTQRMASLFESCLFVKNSGRVESGMELVVDIENGTIPLLALLMFSGAFMHSKIFRISRTLYAVEYSRLLFSNTKSMFSFEWVQGKLVCLFMSAVGGASVERDLLGGPSKVPFRSLATHFVAQRAKGNSHSKPPDEAPLVRLS